MKRQRTKMKGKNANREWQLISPVVESMLRKFLWNHPRWRRKHWSIKTHRSDHYFLKKIGFEFNLRPSRKENDATFVLLALFLAKHYPQKKLEIPVLLVQPIHPCWDRQSPLAAFLHPLPFLVRWCETRRSKATFRPCLGSWRTPTRLKEQIIKIML